jgi:hypothetical protein
MLKGQSGSNSVSSVNELIIHPGRRIMQDGIGSKIVTDNIKINNKL